MPPLGAKKGFTRKREEADEEGSGKEEQSGMSQAFRVNMPRERNLKTFTSSSTQDKWSYLLEKASIEQSAITLSGDTAAAYQEELDSATSKPLKISAPELSNTMQENYKGQKRYQAFVEKRDTLASKKFQPNFGKIKAQQDTKNSIRFDYQPHVCKDYKDSGYCGFGDSCIYVHDRGDYKMGWELDKEWEEKHGQLDVDPDKFLIAEDEAQEERDDYPSMCPICQCDFELPVCTKCFHYFCEKCALQQYRKSPKCYTCQTVINGLFLPAKDLRRKLQEKSKRLEAERKEIEKELEQEVAHFEDEDDEREDGRVDSVANL